MALPLTLTAATGTHKMELCVRWYTVSNGFAQRKTACTHSYTYVPGRVRDCALSAVCAAGTGSAGGRVDHRGQAVGGHHGG